MNPPTPNTKKPLTRGRQAAVAAAIASAIAIPAEGLRQFAYLDPPGILTVCYGSTTNVVKNKKYSLEECKARLDADMLNAVTIVQTCAPPMPTVNMLAAWADAVYNIGPKIVCNDKASTAARLLQARQFAAACDQLPRWDKATVAGAMVTLPGLSKRRAAERALCLTPDVDYSAAADTSTNSASAAPTANSAGPSQPK